MDITASSIIVSIITLLIYKYCNFSYNYDYEYEYIKLPAIVRAYSRG